jgi:glycosyltransferase involved in cell wall biosynthesis
MTPRVTVIMPAYNLEACLADAIESVLAQNYTDYELVIVDDGSTDGTLAIARRYAEAHPSRTRVITQPNGGVAAARNTAIRAARGVIFALLDADDIWTPAYLAEQIRIFDAEPGVDIITGNAFDRGGSQDGRPTRPFPDRRPEPGLLEILADETAVFIMSSFRRSVVDKIGGFDENLRTNEDYDYWIRAARAGCRFRRNPRPLGWYRRRAGSLSANDVHMLHGILRVYRKAAATIEPGSAEAAIITRQVERFETERLKAEARAAIARGDAAGAAELVDALNARSGRWSLRVFGLALRYAPRIALWALRTRRQMKGARPAPAGILAGAPQR